jgi:GNAT superfamily N-acetyltransferase
MSPVELFQEYVADRRGMHIEGFHREVLRHLVRYTPAVENGMEGFVLFSDLPPEAALEGIQEQIRYFAGRGEAFEWKVYDLERPAGLRRLLEQEGFVAGPAEALLILPLDGREIPPAPVAEGIRVERVRDEARLRQVIAVHGEVWERDFSWLFDTLARGVVEQHPELSVYCACSGARPVGIGWITFPTGSRFAELHGGAVLPEVRGQGIYSLLFHERLQEARSRGYHYLAVDASPMSRPILERKGFVHVCYSYPMRKAAPA